MLRLSGIKPEAEASMPQSTMVRVHLLQVSLNLSDPEMESYLASDMVARNFCRVSSTRLFISDSTILRFRHFIEHMGWRKNSSSAR